jgi:hypothetical protein
MRETVKADGVNATSLDRAIIYGCPGLISIKSRTAKASVGLRYSIPRRRPEIWN